jgi:acetyl esterase/lipase
MFSEVQEPDVKGSWAVPSSTAPARAIFFIHGGGYHLGDATSYRGFVSQIAARTKCRVFAVDYPLAPEHRFPAAYDAVAKARGWFIAAGVMDYAIMGDSAGGGLALALLNEPNSRKNSSSAVVFSPWTDLSLTGASFSDPATSDPVFKPEMLAGLAGSYLQGAEPKDWRASPLYGIPDLLPPTLIQVGTNELLLDDATRYAEAAARKGGEVRLELFEGLHHVFQRDAGSLSIADQAIEQAAGFVSAHWAR